MIEVIFMLSASACMLVFAVLAIFMCLHVWRDMDR